MNKFNHDHEVYDLLRNMDSSIFEEVVDFDRVQYFRRGMCGWRNES